MNTEASPYLFKPRQQKLHSIHSPVADPRREQADVVNESIHRLLGDKGYPCIPAQLSLKKEEYLVGLYPGFGTGVRSREMAEDILYFRRGLHPESFLFTSFWAVFPDDQVGSEEEFEDKMWKELSYMSSFKDLNPSWDENFSSDPKDPRFCFSLGGEAYFVVGMHLLSSRVSRRFPYPAILFNLFDQFEELERRGQYDTMVKNNRDRDRRYQGGLNPMVEKYADKWESIQFSGKNNSPEWKCPFHHGLKPGN